MKLSTRLSTGHHVTMEIPDDVPDYLSRQVIKETIEALREYANSLELALQTEEG